MADKSLDPKDRFRGKEELRDKLAPLVELIRKRRQIVDDQWLKSHHAWMGVQTYSYYKSEFNHFIPAYRRVIERYVARVVQQLMPHHEFFNAFPGNERDLAADTHGDATQRYMSWLLNDHIKVRRVVEQLVRTRLLYSRCITKNTVQKIQVPTVEYGRFVGSVKQTWPSTRAVDPFNFFIWPETSMGADDAIIVMEDVIMPWVEYQDAVDRKVADAIPRSDLQRPKFPQHLQMRFDVSGLFTPEETVTGGDKAQDDRSLVQQNFVEITELFLRGLSGGWLHIWLAHNVTGGPRIVRVHRAAYPRAPYRMSVSRELPSQHYTPSVGADLEGLQILLNDQFNQGEEARAVTSGPPVIIDTTRVKRADSFVFGYRRKWYGDPDGVKMLEIPDTSQSAMRAAAFTLAYMEGQVPPLSQGQVPRGLPRGSGAVGSLISLASADIVGDARAIEEDCLTPTIQDLYHLTLAFVPQEQVIQIPGAEGFQPMELTVDDLYGGWHFKWTGANRMQDLQAQTSQALIFIQSLSRMADTLRLQGWTIDWGLISRIFWKDLLGEKRLAYVIRQMTPQERGAELAIQAMMQGGITAPGKAPGPASSGARAATERPTRESVVGGGGGQEG